MFICQSDVAKCFCMIFYQVYCTGLLFTPEAMNIDLFFPYQTSHVSILVFVSTLFINLLLTFPCSNSMEYIPWGFKGMLAPPLSFPALALCFWCIGEFATRRIPLALIVWPVKQKWLDLCSTSITLDYATWEMHDVKTNMETFFLEICSNYEKWKWESWVRYHDKETVIVATWCNRCWWKLRKGQFYVGIARIQNK